MEYNLDKYAMNDLITDAWKTRAIQTVGHERSFKADQASTSDRIINTVINLKGSRAENATTKMNEMHVLHSLLLKQEIEQLPNSFVRY